MLLARSGDIDGTCGEGDGCANGDYFMNHNIANQGISDPDPVDQLREVYDAWRLELTGRPDAIESTVEFDTPSIPPNGGSSATMSIYLRDWQGIPVTTGVDSVTATCAEGSDMVTVVRDVRDLGDGQYAADVWGLESEGVDSYIVTAYDGIRPVQLAPNPVMTVAVPEGGFELLPPTPGIAGEVNDICVTGGTPGSTVFFVYGSERGRVMTACGSLAIPDGVLVGEAVVEGNGGTCFSQMVDQNAQGVSVRFQAVQVPGCDRSNVVVHEFE